MWLSVLVHLYLRQSNHRYKHLRSILHTTLQCLLTHQSTLSDLLFQPVFYPWPSCFVKVVVNAFTSPVVAISVLLPRNFLAVTVVKVCTLLMAPNNRYLWIPTIVFMDFLNTNAQHSHHHWLTRWSPVGTASDSLTHRWLRDEGLFNISYQWILAGKCMQEYQRSLPLDHEKKCDVRLWVSVCIRCQFSSWKVWSVISIFIDVYYICIYTYNVLYARYIYGERTWRKVPLFERFRVRGLPEQCKIIIWNQRWSRHINIRIHGNIAIRI